VELSGKKIIGIVAVESSGDSLGAGLIQELKKLDSNYEFIGIGGPKMIAQGFKSLFSQDRLAVMGFIEPLKRLPEILSIRRKLINFFLENKTQVYIGIDGPDFNLNIEKKLKHNGIKTVHYVSPTIWAWRPKRIFKIKKSTNHNLLIYPFEKQIYDSHNIPATYVGHPLGVEIPLGAAKPSLEDLNNYRKTALNKLNLNPDKKYISLLPGSRGAELSFHVQPLLETAVILVELYPEIEFIIPCVNEAREKQFKELSQKYSNKLKLHIIKGQTTEALQAADASMVCSGTATLQALLCKNPFLIIYKTGSITFRIAKFLVKTKYIGMANIIANRLLAPEFIQDNVIPENIAKEIIKYLEDKDYQSNFYNQCYDIHKGLRLDTNSIAAKTVMKLISS
jgi:lipid-A-disaccharide synthase